MIGRKMILAMAGVMMFASAFADTQTVNGVTWTYAIANGEATITTGTSYQRAVSPEPVGSVTIPDELGGCPVTTIGEYAFYHCAKMTAVTFPSRLVNVGVRAFDASGLTSVEIPSGVIGIGGYAFYGCRQLVSVSIPSTVIDIGNDAFTECDALTEFAIDSSNENFRMQNGLLCNREGTHVHTCLGGLRGSVTIPAGVTSISGFAFARCPGLTEILVDAGNEAYYSEGGVLYEKATKGLIQCPSGKTGIVTISEGVTEIGPEAFDNCKVTKVVIPSSVTRIGWGAFRYSQDLKSVCFKGNAPNERVSLDVYSGSPYVTNYVRAGSVGWKSPNSADLPDLWPVDADSDARPIVRWTDEPAIMHSVIFILGEHGTRIGGGELEQTVLGGTAAVAPEVMPQAGWEFRGWSGDIECVAEDMVVLARFSKEGAFDDGSYTMTTNGVTWTFDVVGGEATITECAEDPVGHLDIPGELGGCPVVGLGVSLFDNDFRSTPDFVSVTIPASVVFIDDYAFYACSALRQVTYEGDESGIEFGEAVFYGTLYYGREAPQLMVEDGVLYGIEWIDGCHDDGCITNGVLVIPAGVTNIAEGALCGSEDFEAVVLPSSLETIEAEAFSNCCSLREVTGGENLRRVGYDAFYWTPFLYGVESLDGFDEPTEGLGFAKVGNFIVGRYGSLEEASSDNWYDPDTGERLWSYDLVIPEGTTGLADGLCDSLPITSLMIPGSVKRIPDYAFNSCCQLRTLAIGEGVGEIGECAFACAGCEWCIERITLPSTLKRIESCAFSCFGYLKYVDGLGVCVDVAEDAFECTPYLDGWEAPQPVVEDGVLYGIDWIDGCHDDGCITNGVLVIPAGVTNIAEGALCGSEDFEAVVLPSSLETIEAEAFSNCCSLRAVTGGENLRRVGYDAFYWTPFLYGVESLDGFDEPTEGLGFAKVGNFIVGRYGCLDEAWNGDQYEPDTGEWLWSYDLVISEGTTGLADGLCDSLPITSLMIPGSVKRIPDYAFNSCCQLRTLAIGEGVEEIGECAFACAGCEWCIERITLPSTLKRIESCAFSGFGYLKYVDGLGACVDVAEDAFECTPYLDGWEAPQLMVEDGVLYGIEWIDGCHDDGCLTNGVLFLPTEVTTVASWALADLEGLREIRLASTAVAFASDALGDDECFIGGISFSLPDRNRMVRGWNVCPADEPSAQTNDLVYVAGGEVFFWGPDFVATPVVEKVEVGPGKVSSFMMSSDGGICSPSAERAVIAGISGVTGMEFFGWVPYLGNGGDEVDSCCCLTYPGIIDVEKTEEEDADDYSCWELPKINMAYWGGYVSKADWPTEDAVADAYRKNGCWEDVFAWLEVPTNRIDWSYSEGAADFNEFIVRHLKDGNALVELTTWESGHGITCCGYVCDESRELWEPGYLTGLFIVDSDNDMYVNGGAAGAPNRITYCPLEWVGEGCSGSYMIGNVWGLEWDYVYIENALWAKGTDLAAVRLEWAKTEAIEAIEGAANDLAGNRSGWNAALTALVKDAVAAVAAATTPEDAKAAGKAGVARIEAFGNEVASKVTGFIANIESYENVCVGFRRITAVGSEVWAEVSEKGTFTAELSIGDWQVAVEAWRRSDGAFYTATESLTVTDGAVTFDLVLPDDEHLGNATVDLDDAGQYANVGVGGLSAIARKTAAAEGKSVALELKISDPELVIAHDERPVLRMMASARTLQASANAPVAATSAASRLAAVEKLRKAAEAVNADRDKQVNMLSVALSRSDDGGNTWSDVEALEDDTVDVTIPLEFDTKADFTILRSDGQEVESVRRIVDNGLNAHATGSDESFRVEPGKVVMKISRFAVFAVVSGAPRGRLYPDGDGAYVVPTAAVSYEGVLLRDGAVAGTVSASVSKPNVKKDTVANITLKVKTIENASYAFAAKKEPLLGSDGRFVLEPSNKKSASLGAATVVFSGDSLVGSFANGLEIDAVRDVFKVKGDVKRDRISRYVQNGRSWCVALASDATELGYATLGVKVSANGKVNVTGYMGDGVKLSTSAKAEIGQGWLAVPVVMNKKSGKTLKTFGCRVSLDEASGKVGIANATPYAGSSFVLTASGLPELTKAEVKTATLSVATGDALASTPDAVKLTYNEKSGAIGGTATWLNAGGKKKLTGKVYGVATGRQGFGEVVVKGVGTFRFTLVLAR